MLRTELIAQSGQSNAEQPPNQIWHCLDYRACPTALDLGRFRKTDFCFALVRQAILCAGDTTLEPGEAQYNEHGTPIAAVFDGLGATHQCRSWDAIQEATNSRRVSNLSFSIVDA
jgi:hypothetical protein